MKVPIGAMLVLGVLTACGDSATHGLPTFPTNDLAERAVGYMVDVGCKPHRGATVTGVVTLPLPSGETVKVDCGGVSPESVRAGVSAFNRSVMPISDGSVGLPSAQAYQQSTTYYTCEIEITWEYIPMFGEYWVVDVDINWCRTYTVYHGGEAPGGGWGGGGPNEAPVKVFPPPSPFDSMTMEKMNQYEKAACIANSGECLAYINMAVEALDKIRSLAPTSASLHGDIWDARRHAYWNALLTVVWGGDVNKVKYWTDLHEMNNAPAGDKCQDYHNNQVGRDVGVALRAQYGGFPTTTEIWAAIVNNPNLQASFGCPIA